MAVSEREVLIFHCNPDADESICHVSDPRRPFFTLCGMKEAHRHATHNGEYKDGVCTGCGRGYCKTCAIMEWAA